MSSNADAPGQRLLCIDARQQPLTSGNLEPLRQTLHWVCRNTAYLTGIRVYLPAQRPDLAQPESSAARLQLLPPAGLPSDIALEWRQAPQTGAQPQVQDLLADAPPAAAELIYLAAGALLPPGWDTRLRQATAAEPSIGAVSPLCQHLPPLAERLPRWPLSAADDASWLDTDRQLAGLGAKARLQIDTWMPICCYFSAAALAELRGAEHPHPRHLQQAGLVNLLTLNMLVGWGAQAPLPAQAQTTLKALLQYSPALDWLRNSLLRPPQRPAPAAAPSAQQPVQLHLTHSWGGGLGHWVDDFVDGDSARRNLILKSIGTWGAFGQRLELYTRYSEIAPARSWELNPAIADTALAHLHYRAVLQEIIADYGVQALLVSSLIGHSLDALQTGHPTLMIAHDHYPFCVTLYAYFDGVCEHCDQARLQRCLADNPGHSFFRGVDVSHWQALRRAFQRSLERNPVTLAAPSASTLARWRSQMPALARVPARVIAHGLSLAPSPSLAGTDQGRLRIVILGRLSWAKGLALLEQALPSLAQLAELHLIGCGESGRRFATLPGVHITEHYQRARLGDLLSQARPHLGLLSSVVPETFSYTLSELNHFGIPVLATRGGSFTDRIHPGATGFLCEPEPSALVDAVHGLNANRAALACVRQQLRAQPPRTLADMVQEYHALLPLTPHGAPKLGLRPGTRTAAEQVLYVQPAATYRQVLLAFTRYSRSKLYHSPRFPKPLRRLFAFTWRFMRGLARRWQRRPKNL